MKRLIAVLFALTASPAMAAEEGPFFSLHNAEFVVTIGFLVFIGLLIYLGIPKLLAKLLDNRAVQISTELNEARMLREEAKALLASYDKKMKDVAEQSARIIGTAKEEAQAAAAQAKVDLASAITRRLAAAEDQIESAVKAAERAVRDQAISVSIAVAGEVLAKQMTADGAKASIDAAIGEVAAKLH
ncbi:MAG: ATP F0F1 synthase subunit B [Paracoccaceae bacterium]